MIQFLGNIEAKADAKGRVFIPATFRKQLQAASEERLVLRKDVYQDCLVLYPESVWFATQNQLRCRLNKWNAKQQMIFRQFVSDAEVMTVCLYTYGSALCSIHGLLYFNVLSIFFSVYSNIVIICLTI